LQLVGLGIPSVAAEFHKIYGGLQPCLAFEPCAVGNPKGEHVRSLPRIDVGQLQLVFRGAVRLAKVG
jgi:hypothetical protein